MPEITSVYRQTLPKMKFVGISYTDNDRENGTFSNKWNKWFKNNLFAPLMLPNSPEPFEDCKAYYGLCRCKDDEPFKYIIGVFMPPDANVPDGYESIEFDGGNIAVCLIHGKEPDIYTYCCLERLNQEGYEWTEDKNGVRWCFERYVSPRFTVPDEEGNVILDMCFFVK